MLTPGIAISTLTWAAAGVATVVGPSSIDTAMSAWRSAVLRHGCRSDDPRRANLTAAMTVSAAVITMTVMPAIETETDRRTVISRTVNQRRTVVRRRPHIHHRRRLVVTRLQRNRHAAAQCEKR